MDTTKEQPDTSIQLGDYQINGNSDYLFDYEKTAIFSPKDQIYVGQSPSGTYCYSSNTDQDGNIREIVAQFLHDGSNTNAKANSGKTTRTLPLNEIGYKATGYRVAQYIEDGPVTRTAVFYDGDSDQKVVFYRSPEHWEDAPVQQTAVFKEKGNQLFGTAAYEMFAIQDNLLSNPLGALNFNYTGNNQFDFSLTNMDFFQKQDTPILATRVLKFSSDYIQLKDEKAGQGLLCMSFILKVEDLKTNPLPNVLLICTFNSKTGDFQKVVIYHGDLADSDSEPTHLCSYAETNNRFIYVGCTGEKNKGYTISKVDPGLGGNGFNVGPIFRSEYGELQDFDIGPEGQFHEFWASVKFEGGNVLYTATKPNKPKSTFCKPYPVCAIQDYVYFTDVSDPQKPNGNVLIRTAEPGKIAGKEALGNSLVAASTGPGQLIHFWSSENQGHRVIKSNLIKVPKTTISKYSISATYLNFKHNETNPGHQHNIKMPPTVSISSSDRTYAEVNGTLYHFAPGKPVDVTADIQNRITIKRHSSTLDSEDFTVQIKGESGSFNVNTRANAQKNLGKTSKTSDNQALQKVGPKLSALAKSQNNGKNLPVLSLPEATNPHSSPPNNRGFMAIAFDTGGVEFYDDEVAFHARKTVPPSSDLLGGIWDDLWEDFKSAVDDLEKVTCEFLTSAENFVSKVTSIVVKDASMVINFVDKVATIALTCLEDTWKAIKFVVSKIISTVELLIDAIGAFVDIIETVISSTKVISGVLEDGMNSVVDVLKRGKVKTSLEKYFTDINQKLDIVPNHNKPKPPAHSHAAHQRFFGSTAINFVMEKIAELLSGHDSDNNFEYADGIFNLAKDVAKTMEDLITDLFDCLDLENLHEQFNRLSTELSQDLKTDLIQIEKVIKGILTSFGNGLAAELKGTEKSLEGSILLDIIEDVIGVDSLSYFDIIAFIISVPGAVLYDLVADLAGGNKENPIIELGKKGPQNGQTWLQAIGIDRPMGIIPLLETGPNFESTQETSFKEQALDSEESFTKEIAPYLSLCGAGVGLIQYFTINVPESKDENFKLGQAGKGIKYSAMGLTLTNWTLGIINSTGREKGANAFLVLIKLIILLAGTWEPTHAGGDKDKALLKFYLSFLCLGAEGITKEHVEDILKVVHPMIDTMSEVMLEYNKFKTSAVFEIIAVGITVSEALAEIIEEA